MIEDIPGFKGLRRLRQHYRIVFKDPNPSNDAVMADLMKFCRFWATTHEPGVSIERLEGRREVMLRILQFMQLTPEELFAYVSGMDNETRFALFNNRLPSLPFEE